MLVLLLLATWDNLRLVPIVPSVAIVLLVIVLGAWLVILCVLPWLVLACLLILPIIIPGTHVVVLLWGHYLAVTHWFLDIHASVLRTSALCVACVVVPGHLVGGLLYLAGVVVADRAAVVALQVDFRDVSRYGGAFGLDYGLGLRVYLDGLKGCLLFLESGDRLPGVGSRAERLLTASVAFQPLPILVTTHLSGLFHLRLIIFDAIIFLCLHSFSFDVLGIIIFANIYFYSIIILPW